MHRAASLMVSIGLVAVSSAAALGQQQVNPVTINPGASGGGTANGLTVNLSPTYAFGYPYAYGGFPTVYGGGVFVSNGSGFFTGTGYYGGYSGYGFGTSSFDDPLARQQQYALANSRYEMQNAQASEAYAKANYFQQQAIAASIKNAQAAPQPPIRERFNARTTRPRGAVQPAKAEPNLALDKLVNKDGDVLWPTAAPKDGSRDEFDAAIASLAKQFQDAGKADVQDVNATRDLLQKYGVPALAKLRRDRPAQAPALKTFLNSLDATLVGWAK